MPSASRRKSSTACWRCAAPAATLAILVDSLAAAQAVVDKGRADKHAFEAMIEIDSDGHRSGVRPDDDLLIEIGRLPPPTAARRSRA